MSNLGNINTRMVQFSDVHPMPNNPRIIDDINLKGLKASLNRFGYVEPVVWNETTGHIVGGHQRFSVLVSQGLTEAIMVVVNMDSREEMAANLTLNNPEIEGVYSDEAVGLMEKLQGDGDLFQNLRLDDLMKNLNNRFSNPKEQHFKNKEVNVDLLVSNCDSNCPCCGFVWKADARDRVVLEKTDEE